MGSGSANVETLASDESLSSGRTSRRPEPEAGTEIGRYLVLDRLGAGGMGVVYAAYDPELDRKVAIKLLRAGLGGRGSRGRARLLREAQAMAKIDHPNVVAVHDVGTVDGRVYVAMEHVDGTTLTRWLADESPPPPQILDAFVAAGRGLAAAHEEGLVHRDFKPDNVMIDARDGDDSGRRRVRVMDFGLAHGERAPTGSTDSLSVSQGSGSRLSVKLTRDGALVGTPAYMAPEQFEGATTDARTDQFAFCVALWEALCGERPFSGTTTPALVESVLDGRIRSPPRDAKMSTRVRRALTRGLSVAREDRWPSMGALLAELQPPPARRPVLWAAGGVLVTATLGTIAWAQTRPEPCAGSASALAEVYDDARRARVGAAVLDSGAAFAPAVWGRIEPALDAWADDWVATHTDACEATHVRGEQSAALMDQRMACLARARTELAATLDVLEAADPSALAKAHRLVARLPPLRACSDPDALARQVAPPPADAAEIVATIRATLAAAKAHRTAGDLEAAQAAVATAQSLAAEVDYEPLTAELAVEAAAVHTAAGRYEPAETQLTTAREIAARLDLRDIVRDATVQLVYLRGYVRGRPEAAWAVADLARGLTADDDRARASLANNVGAVYQAQGQYAEAEASFREALAFKTEAFGPDDPEIARARSNLAVALHGQGKYAEAEAEHRAALQIRRAALGPMHPSLATSYNNLAEALIAQGRFAEAEVQHRAGLELSLAAFGPPPPGVATPRYSMANAIAAQGRYEEAQAEHRAALDVLLRKLGPDHPDVASVRSDLGNVLLWQGEYAEAETLFRQAIATVTELHGPDHPQVAMIRGNLAALLAATDRPDEAQAECEASLAGLTKSLGEDHPHVAQAHVNLADVLRTTGQAARAEAEYETALAGFARSVGDDHPGAVMAHAGLGLLLVGTDRPDDAHAHLDLAWAARESAGLTKDLIAELAAARDGVATPSPYGAGRLDPREATP